MVLEINKWWRSFMVCVLWRKAANNPRNVWMHEAEASQMEFWKSERKGFPLKPEADTEDTKKALREV